MSTVMEDKNGPMPPAKRITGPSAHATCKNDMNTGHPTWRTNDVDSPGRLLDGITRAG